MPSLLKLFIVMFLACQWPALAGAAQGGALAPGMVNPGYEEKPDWFKESFLDIRDDVSEAGSGGRRVLLYFYQDGCPYCAKLLRENYAIREIEEKTRAGFDVIAINMWGDRDVTGFSGEALTEKEFAKKLKVMFTPTLLFLDEAGAVVLRVNGYYPPHKFMSALDYVSGRQEKTMGFRDFYAGRAPKAAGVLHTEEGFMQPPYVLTGEARGGKDAARPLLVLFEQVQCAPCDELHQDILQRGESRRLLEQFDVVLLDMWSKGAVTTPGGEQTTAGEWARRLDIKYAPSMVFFGADGGEVFRTEAYLRAFHVQSSMDYVLSGAFRDEPEFQRYISGRADALEAQGIHVDIMQ